MLSVIHAWHAVMLSIVMLSAIMLNVVAPFICLTKLQTQKVGFEPRKVYLEHETTGQCYGCTLQVWRKS